MHKFLFAEVATDKRAYRLIEVVEESLDLARQRLPTRLGVAYLATKPASPKTRPGVKSRLYRDRETWADFLDKFFLTVKEIDAKMTAGLYADMTGGR